MPTALVEVRREYTQEQESAIINAVHAAMLQALKIPEWDRNVRLVVHPPHRFACPPDKAQPDRYTLVSIDLFAGRLLDAKRALYQAIVDNLGKLGVPKDHVLINLHEIARENWGVRGVPASEVELGFKVEV